ncbi:MAG: AAA family ATPase [Candidatus Dormibacteraeota bacterium]|nr:AAA family ATPase [Candidatus Dormibacteraeota bacterium]
MPVCPSCGEENPERARFCLACATPLAKEVPEREERKVVTILFADLVGFTSRAEHLDPEDVRAMLRPYYARLRSELGRFGGTVEKFIGDAVMAVFGAPVVHEDDAERAVRAALAIRDAVAELNHAEPDLDLHVRIGINTGEALVTVGARPARGEGMVVGDVVNTSARLQAAAPVDGILVGESTFRATVSGIEYRVLEPVDAKGKSAPVAAWEVVEAYSRLGVDIQRGSRTPLIGRASELELLGSALARARSRRATQLVTFVGVPGIGKSRLVAELLSVVEEDHELIVWRQGRSLPYGEAVSFWALGEMVKAQAGILESDSEERAGDMLRRAVAEVVSPEDNPSWVEEHLRPLAGLARHSETQGDRRAESFVAWRCFFESLAERGPTVLVFEDLHWADDGLLDFIDELVDWVTDVPLLVVCTARPELLTRRPGWGGGKPDAVTVSLSPLSDEETAHLLAGVLGRSAVSIDLQSALLVRAGGNPLYAEEFARLAAERENGSDVSGLRLPESVHGIIAARLDGLDRDEKALLQDASVFGKVFWLGAVSALAEGEQDLIGNRLHKLEKGKLVRREHRSTVGGETQYAFSHQLVRDVAYGQVPRARRAEKHWRAGEWIAALAGDRLEDRAELLAYHYTAALELARAAGEETSRIVDPARLALRAAAQRALALNSFEAACRFYSQALELWPADDADRPRVLFDYGRALWFQDRTAAEVLTEARDGLLAGGHTEVAAEAEILLADIAWRAGDGDLERAHLEHALALVHNAGPSASKAAVLVQAARLLMIADRYAEAIALAQEGIALDERFERPALRATALNTIGTARASTGDPAGIGNLEESIAIAESMRSPWDIVRGYVNLASVVGELGDLRRARELQEKGLALARTFGMGASIRFITAELVKGLYYAGEWDEAVRMADELIAEVEAGRPHNLEAQVRCIRARIRFARGDDDGALSDSERAAVAASAMRDPQTVIPTLGLHARLLAHLGRREDAAAVADEVLRRKGERSAVDAILDLLLAADELGRRDEVSRALASIAHVSVRVESARRWLAGDFVGAADAFERAGDLPSAAYCRLSAAEQFVTGGRRAEADAQLELVLDFYVAVGAHEYVRRATALLAATA